MGEIAEMMLDGSLCNTCGAYIEHENDEIPGFPVDCEVCEEEAADD